jgi:hypothetical protein
VSTAGDSRITCRSGKLLSRRLTVVNEVACIQDSQQLAWILASSCNMSAMHQFEECSKFLYEVNEDKIE